MLKRTLNLSIALLLITPAFAQDSSIRIQLERIADGFQAPADGTHAGDGSGRIFIAEQSGKIKIFQNGDVLSEPFLDVSGKRVRINTSYDERGLLGFAFHPHYAENARLFVYYSAPGGSGNHQSVLSEFHVSSGDPNIASDDERIIMTIDEPESNHNGGHLAFGPDGMLYLGLGDGGGANDQHGTIGNGQNTNNLLGTIIRIDVDGTEPYAIPPDNPLAGQEGRDEIWAYGLRNPWKYSFDRLTGRMFCADVGQNRIEEVNIIERGGNYGWRIMEGSDCFNPARNCGQTGLKLPIAEYPHSLGISVTGGYVYRGSQYSSLYGRYIFADWSGILLYLTETGTGQWDMEEFLVNDTDSSQASFFITSFLEDEDGEIYVLANPTSNPGNRSGALYKITVPGDTPVSIDEWRQHH